MIKMFKGGTDSGCQELGVRVGGTREVGVVIKGQHEESLY